MNTRPPVSVPERVTKWMESWLLTQGLDKAVRWELLAGDGSTRVFYRVHLVHDEKILLTDPDWILSKDYAPHQEYLAKAGLPVPRFHAVDPKVGVLLMEDLGDELLQHRILKNPARRLLLMQRAITLLAELHGKTFPVPSQLPAASRQFDTQKYLEELLFTETHLNDALLGLSPVTSERKTKLREFCDSISALRPLVFAHRDYHTRNLLLHKEKLFLIDFQDARLGSIHYDLASFVFDPYVPASDSERESLCQTYRQTLAAFPLSQQIEWQGFDSVLGRVGVQRLIKAAGSYASFYTRYGKRTHLPYLVPALKTAEALLSRYGDKITQKAFPLSEWITKASQL